MYAVSDKERSKNLLGDSIGGGKLFLSASCRVLICILLRSYSKSSMQSSSLLPSKANSKAADILVERSCG
jgi:hypothetical protein